LLLQLALIFNYNNIHIDNHPTMAGKHVRIVYSPRYCDCRILIFSKLCHFLQK